MQTGADSSWKRGGAAEPAGVTVSLALSLLFLILGRRRFARYALGFAVAFAERWRQARLSARVDDLLARSGRDA